MGYDGLGHAYGWERITSEAGGKGVVAGQWGQESTHRNLQGLRQAKQHEDGNIVSAMFNLTEIGIRDTRSRAECLLGQTSLFPILPEGGPKTLER